MEILHLVQGGDADQRIFGFLGSWLVNPSVQEALGCGITAIPGDNWWINISDSGDPIGFAEVRIKKTGWHVRYLYALNPLSATRLLEAIISKARVEGAPMVFTNDRADAEIWRGFRFEMKPTKRRGDFRRWEKSMDIKK